MAGISKYALIFHNRVLSFDEDIELIDIICIAQNNNDFLKDEEKLFAYLDPKKHKRIGARKKTEASKNIVVHHLKSTVYAAYIKDIFEELTAYLKNVMYEAALISKDATKAKRLLGEHRVSLVASDILQYNSLEELTLKITEQIIQALENERSTKDLIKKICNKIDLEVEEEIINKALPYLDLRHKLVHMDGKADEEFKSKYKNFKYDKDDYVKLNQQVISSAKSNISALVKAIDEAAISKEILSSNTP